MVSPCDSGAHWVFHVIYTLPDSSPTQLLSTPIPGFVYESPNPADANAQATIEAGKSQLQDLSRNETQTSFNITQAAATQQLLSRQTSMAQKATVAAQNSTATAAQSIYLMNVSQTQQAQAILDTQSAETRQAESTLTAFPMTATYSAYSLSATGTAQAQAILDVQSTKTAQAIAALTAYPQTETPFAVTQAALLNQEYDQEQQNFVNQIVAPIIPIIAVLDLLLFILVIIQAIRRSISFPRTGRMRFGPGVGNPNRLFMIDGVLVDRDIAPQLPFTAESAPANPETTTDQNAVHIDILDASDPPVAQWIAEVERQMMAEEGKKQ